MRAGFDKWWLLPFGIFDISALVASGIVFLGPSFAGRSSAEVARQAVSEPTGTSSEVATADCSGTFANDYICYQQRYKDIVRDHGVEATFAEIRYELAKNDLASSNCHQLTHVIGRAAAELYGDIPATYVLIRAASAAEWAEISDVAGADG